MRRRQAEEPREKVLDVDASMQGTLTFKDPVNLKINGKFEGKLITRGNLAIGENATVHADINGESVVIAGRVNGNIYAQREIRIIPPGCVQGNIQTPVLVVAEGAVLEGHCNMREGSERQNAGLGNMLSIKEVARFLEVEEGVIHEWASSGKLPAEKEGEGWRFEKDKIEDWLSNEKIK